MDVSAVQVVNALPDGWRKVLTPGGKAYYQNDITKQTQWDPPRSVPSFANEPQLHHVHQHQPQSNTALTTKVDHVPATDSDKNEKKITEAIASVSVKQKAAKATTTVAVGVSLEESISDQDDIHVAKYDVKVAKYNDSPQSPDSDTGTPLVAQPSVIYNNVVLLLFVFLLNVYDYITDILVVYDYINLQNVCPQFNCAIIPSNDYEWIIYPLLVCSSVGFIANLVRNIFEARILYCSYKYPIMSYEDEMEKELRRYRLALYWNWIPLIFEDLALIYMIYLIVFYISFIKGKGITLYLHSVAVSLCNVVITLILMCVKNRKLHNSKAHQQNNAYRKPIWCHCCWCTLNALYAGFIAIALLIADRYHIFFLEPLIDIEDPQNVIGNQEEYGQCWSYGNAFYEVKLVNVYSGDIIKSPQLVYDECYGANYTYNMQCEEDTEEKVKVLYCELKWNFNGATASDCHHKDDSCLFDLNTGICENYTIDCDDFAFFDGKPVMWACFDYCRV